MANNEYQHYVPQMYLRNFSSNGKSIGGYILGERKYVSDMPIDRVCGRKYLYGEDLKIEKWFSDLEGNWANLLRKIISEKNLELSEEEWAYLYMFVFLSDARTGYTADSTVDSATKVAKSIALLGQEHGLVDFSDEEIKKLHVSIDKPNLAHLQSMPTGVEVMQDLAPALIINSSGKGFITSDCPMMKYNPLFVKRRYHRNSGIGQVGAQVLLPLSPDLCLILYDSAVYDIKVKDRVLTLNSADQIIKLNMLLARNAKATVFFNNATPQWLIEKYTRGVKNTSSVFNNTLMRGESGGYLVVSSSFGTMYDAKLSFYSIRKQFMKMPFPNHMAGPLRPNAQRVADRLHKDKPMPKRSGGVFWPVDYFKK